MNKRALKTRPKGRIALTETYVTHTTPIAYSQVNKFTSWEDDLQGLTSGYIKRHQRGAYGQ